MITVTRRFEFCYAHFLPDYEGKCFHMHGHNAVVEIEVRDSPAMRAEIIRHLNEGREEDERITQTYPGMVADFGLIKKYVQPIIDQFDHQQLNGMLLPNTRSFDKQFPPTAENICKVIMNEILRTPLRIGLERVRVSETPNCWAEWRKDIL